MEHIKHKPISEAGAFVHAIAGLVIAALVMLGVGGTVYHLVAPGGWIARAFDRSLAGGMGAILALLIIAACAWMTRTWISVRRRNRHPEVFVYGFALVGAIYAGQFVARGGF